MNQDNQDHVADPKVVETTDAWPIGKILKYVLLPKPKGSPKAGKKEKKIRYGLAGGFAALALFAYISGSSLPSCGQDETTTLVGQIFNSSKIANLVGAKFVSLKDVKEQGHNSNDDIRSCSATLVSTSGEDAIQYSVEWNDKKAHTFLVKLQLLN